MSTEKNKKEVQLPDFKSIIKSVKRYISDVVKLDRGVDKKATIAEIQNKKSMNDANAWMLMCSIVIASIGLSQNSQAIIIGAMLISPLMSPILGIGLGVGINDYNTLFQSLKHLGLAVFITLLTSTIYFAVTPFGDFTDEIKARTLPTFLDILIAIFGGIAGIVSIARKDISTTLPGVAIATALMPPLCVTGYGLANGNWSVASTSFYLFFLNTFFVALSTYLVIRFLKFPLRKYINPEDRKRNMIAVLFIILAAIVPSFLIFRNVLKDLRLEKRSKQFIQEYIGEDNVYLDDYKIEKRDSTNLMILKVYGNKINDSKLPEYYEGLEKLHLHNTKIIIVNSSEVELTDINSIQNKLLTLEQITDRMEETKKHRQEQKSIIQKMATELNNNVIDSTIFVEVTAEIKAIFPNMEQIGLARIQKTDFSNYQGNVPVAILSWNSKITRRQKQSSEIKMRNFLIERLDLDTILIFRH
ncbi:MAG: TIGR00341 family protein [Saprospiraceae bacterium]